MRAAIDPQSAAVLACDLGDGILQVGYITPADSLTLHCCRCATLSSGGGVVQGRIQQQVMVAGNDDFVWVRLPIEPVQSGLKLFKGPRLREISSVDEDVAEREVRLRIMSV